MSQALSTRFPPGTLLGDRYEVVRLLGSGGMAEVYLANDRQLGRHVAVKVIRERYAEDERFVARFRREARAAAALSHPNVVAVHDVGVHDGSPFIVMEHVPGRTLAEIVRDGGALPPERVTEIGQAVARALGSAHAAGIVHRDVKPGNVMVTGDGRVKVLDFGIARALRWTPLTDTPAVQGTAEYMAPEYLRGDGADPRSDIYSLGVVLYELLTGRPPFTGDSPLQVAYQHLEQAPPQPEAVRPGIPAGLAAVVMRCLAKHPGDRYRRAEEVAADLGRLAEGGPGATAPVRTHRTGVLRAAEEDAVAARPPRRRALWWAAATAAVAAILAVTLPLAVGGPDDGEPRRGRRPLRPPTALSAEGRCSGFLDAEVALTWEPTVSRFADGYEVYRGEQSGGPYERVGYVPGHGSTSYIDDDEVDDGATYFYVVKATTGRRDSPPTEQVLVDTPGGCFL